METKVDRAHDADQLLSFMLDYANVQYMFLAISALRSREGRVISVCALV